jgi:MHS family proline/betaine transporter-like MFS transporter
VIAAGMVGNALEFYDFTLYGFFAPIIALNFFPAGDKASALIYSLGVFAFGFLMRPLGAAVFGHLGDRFGRKRALSLSVIMMAIPTALIGALPDYQTIGIFAPILLTLCRLLQGLCTGGEYNGAAIFVLEHQQKDQAGFAGGLITSSCTLGALLGTGVGYVCTLEGMPEWGWRLPFFFGALIGIVGLYIRSQLDESPEFLAASAKPKSPSSRLPLVDALLKHPYSVLCIVGIAWLNGVMYYASFTYVSIYLSTLYDWPTNRSLPIAAVALTVYSLLAPLAGKLSDRWGTGRLMKPAALALALLAYPMYMLLATGELACILVAQLVFACLAAFFSGPINAFMLHLFPVEDRYSGISFSYSLGIALFGGFTPFIMTLVIQTTKNPVSPAYWLIVSALGGLLSLVVIYPRTQRAHSAKTTATST